MCVLTVHPDGQTRQDKIDRFRDTFLVLFVERRHFVIHPCFERETKRNKTFILEHRDDKKKKETAGWLKPYKPKQNPPPAPSEEKAEQQKPSKSKKSVTEQIAKGEKILADPKSPKFLDGHVNKLRAIWEETNTAAQNRLQALKGNEMNGFYLREYEVYESQYI